MNDHDSTKIGMILGGMGYSHTDSDKDAEIILINTCTIREKPQHKAISEIGRALKLKRVNPPKIVGICGCVAQQEGEKLINQFPKLDLVFGPDQIGNLPKMISEIMERDLRVTSLDLINNQADYNFVDLVPYQTSSSATAYVTIIKGCNNFCSYCIVPYVRGREVSRPMDEIVDEIKKLVSNGVREVILLGQNVNSYADRLDNKNHCTSTVAFIDLIRGISQKTNVDRIRFMSPHPKDLSDELIEEYGCNKKLCRHIHLPVQAGSNKILDAMNRRYTREHYISLVEKLQKADPSIAITTDMICGFPGESKDDFRDTLDLVKRARFHNMYAFVYSPRPGTKAADLEDNVSKDEKSERLQTLLELQSGISKEINLGLVGKTVDLLVEGQDRMQSGQLMGRTTQNKIVNFSGQMELVGNIVSVEILRANVNSLEGILSS